jgi:CubicO group peptidase (beta-lactamase class C family)
MTFKTRKQNIIPVPFMKPSLWLIGLSGLLILGIVILQGINSMKPALDQSNIRLVLDEYAGKEVPGLQYIVLNTNETLFEYAGGWADLRSQRPMTLDTTMMAYSMTKTITAVTILQLVEQGRVGLEDPITRYLSDNPYGDQITIRQLLDHTSGIPNPIPLRWAHLVEEHGKFDENAALAQVLREHSRLDFQPGAKFSYSNIGYWLLGKVVEKVTGRPFTAVVQKNVLEPLHIPASELGFGIPNPASHASGYLARYSMMNLFKGFVTDSKYWGSYSGNWLEVKSHQLNGPAFGGLVGTARGFTYFLQDQLQPESVLLGSATKQLLETQQTNQAGELVPMTLGWHIGETNGVVYYFKEGGGGGFHCEMRIYPSLDIASIVMTNSTEFNSTQFLNRYDSVFLGAAHE